MMTIKTVGKFFVDYLMLASALSVSVVAAYYSISGLTSIFPGALFPVIIMGSALEIAKVITTVWLHNNWYRIKLFLKLYLCTAIIILMTITSMGIFGYLSRAHVSQALTSDTIQSSITAIDYQITSLQADQKSAQDTLIQLDAAINQVVVHSSTDNSAVRALHLRNSQQKERQQTNQQLKDDQKQIDQLRDRAIPLKLQLQKSAIDVGPIKYIAALIYGDSPNQNLLERAVRWVIILLVIVFDPMAIAMLLAFTSTEDRHVIAEAQAQSADSTHELVDTLRRKFSELQAECAQRETEYNQKLQEFQTSARDDQSIEELKQELQLIHDSHAQALDLKKQNEEELKKKVLDFEQEINIAKEEIAQLQQDRDSLAAAYEITEQKLQKFTAADSSSVEELIDQVVDRLVEQKREILV